MKARQTVPFIAGLILVPVGGIVALLGVIAVGMLLFSAAIFGDLTNFVILVAPYAFGYGFLITAPITLVVLPITYLYLRRNSALGVGKFVLAGVISASFEALIFVFESLTSTGRLEHVSLFFSAITLIIGVTVGFVFAHLTRLVRPADWNLRPELMPSGA
jgi:hypothetical protein